MKYLKTYENLNNMPEIEIGDYVVCVDHNDDDDLVKFLSENVGRVEIIKPNKEWLGINFDNIPKKLIDDYTDPPWDFDMSEIVFISKNREDCELYLSVKKYNL